MTIKIKMLCDSIKITETYLKNSVYIDSIVNIKFLKKGEYQRQEAFEYILVMIAFLLLMLILKFILHQSL